MEAMQAAVDEGSIAYPPQITQQQAAVLERALQARTFSSGHTHSDPGISRFDHTAFQRTHMRTNIHIHTHIHPRNVFSVYILVETSRAATSSALRSKKNRVRVMIAAAGVPHNVVSMSIDCPEVLQKVRGWSSTAQGPALARAPSAAIAATRVDMTDADFGSATAPGKAWAPLDLNHALVSRIQSIGAVRLQPSLQFPAPFCVGSDTQMHVKSNRIHLSIEQGTRVAHAACLTAYCVQRPKCLVIRVSGAAWWTCLDCGIALLGAGHANGSQGLPVGRPRHGPHQQRCNRAHPQRLHCQCR